MSGAANIVNTLKTKIKENADELEKFEVICEETRVRYNEERKAREEIDNEVLSLNRKIKLLEDNMKRNEDRYSIRVMFYSKNFVTHHPQQGTICKRF